MPSRMPIISEPSPIFGMNTRDDQTVLRPGECVSLVNAYPGDPIVPIPGSLHFKIANTDGWRYASKGVGFTTSDGTPYVVIWITDETDYQLVQINVTTREMTVLGTASGVEDPLFSFIRIQDNIYCIVNKNYSWNGATEKSNHKILEISSSGIIQAVTEMSIPIAGEVEDVELFDAGTIFPISGSVQYAFTFIKLSEAVAFDSNGKAKTTTVFTTGKLEGIEDILNRVTVSGTGEWGTNIVTLATTSTDLKDVFKRATLLGATHIRVYRSRLLASTTLAAGATKFYTMDIPIPDTDIGERTINDITLIAQDATFTITGHGFSTGDVSFFNLPGIGNAIAACTKDSNDIMTIDNSFDRGVIFAAGAKASQGYLTIASIDFTYNKLRLTTTVAHGFNPTDEIQLSGITEESTEPEEYIYAESAIEDRAVFVNQFDEVSVTAGAAADGVSEEDWVRKETNRIAVAEGNTLIRIASVTSNVTVEESWFVKFKARENPTSYWKYTQDFVAFKQLSSGFGPPTLTLVPTSKTYQYTGDVVLTGVAATGLTAEQWVAQRALADALKEGYAAFTDTFYQFDAFYWYVYPNYPEWWTAPAIRRRHSFCFTKTEVDAGIAKKGGTAAEWIRNKAYSILTQNRWWWDTTLGPIGDVFWVEPIDTTVGTAGAAVIVNGGVQTAWEDKTKVYTRDEVTKITNNSLNMATPLSSATKVALMNYTIKIMGELIPPLAVQVVKIGNIVQVDSSFTFEFKRDMEKVWQSTYYRLVWTKLKRMSLARTALNGYTATPILVETVIDTTTVELDILSSTFFKKFIPLIASSVTATLKQYIYPDAQLYPTATGGQIATYLDIESVVPSKDEIVIETTANHDLNTGDNVLLDAIVGADELNDYSGTITVIDDLNFKLNNKSTDGISPYTSGGTIESSSNPLGILDTVTDASLAGETAQLPVNIYSAAPLGAYVEYALTRLWLFGLVDDEKARAYYSEAPGEDGATPIDFATANPQKFLSMFNFNYYVDFSTKRGFLPTGIKRLGGDLYFFFEGEIYALFTSNPQRAAPTLISDQIGCAFPDTLISCDSMVFGGQFLFFISNKGPAILKLGGETRLLTEFKIGELWPDTKNNDIDTDELFADLTSDREHIIHNCSAEYWRNTIWVSYLNTDGTKKVYGFYLNPRLGREENVPAGAFQVELASF